DAFLQHIQTIERDPDQDLEGITQNKLGNNPQPGEEAKQANWLISQEPEVLGITELSDPKAAQDLARFGLTGKRAYVGLRTNNTFEALAAWRKLVGDDKLAMDSVRLIINARVIRRLCSACKIPFKPDPQMVRKLNLNPKVETIYQARNEPLLDAKGNTISCEFCHDLRYKGRNGMFETLLKI